VSRGKRSRKAQAERKRHRRARNFLRTSTELRRLESRARTATLEELEEWQRYAARIGLGAAKLTRSADGLSSFSYQTVVIPSYEGEEDAWLAKLYERAKLRHRRGRLQEDGGALWFELEGPGGWVLIGRKVQMPIETTGDI